MGSGTKASGSLLTSDFVTKHTRSPALNHLKVFLYVFFYKIFRVALSLCRFQICLALSALFALSTHSLYYFYLACIFFLYSLYCFSKKDTCLLFFPLSVSGATIVYFLYYYSFSIHFRDHLATWRRQSAFAFEKGRQAGSLCRPRQKSHYRVLIPFILVPFLLTLFPFLFNLFLFLPPKGTTLISSLYLFCLACIFFTQNLSQKRYNPCFHYPHSCRAQLFY